MDTGKFNKITGMLWSVVLFALIACGALCGFSKNAQAEGWQEGWEINVGVGYIGEVADGKAFSGLDFNFEVGNRYNKRFKWFNIEASFRYIISHTEDICYIPGPNDWRRTQYCDAEAMGFSVFLIPQVYLYAGDSFDLFAKVGPGFIMPTYNDRVADFGLRFGMGMTFKLYDSFGLGFNADYDLAVLSTKDSGSHCGYIDVLFHLLFKI